MIVNIQYKVKKFYECNSYKKTLLSEPITYIIPAIWGARLDGELTPVQIEINKQIQPVVTKIYQVFEFENLNPAQEFAILYILRGLLVAKITFMIEAMKNQVTSWRMSADELARTDPMGTA